MMLSTMKMYRAVEQNGDRVEFVNGIGGVLGKPYKYKCKTKADATAFAAYCNRHDPKNPDMPIAVGSDVARQFNATKA